LATPSCYNVYMTSAANQYATRVYAEHPISMWTLDEDVHYLSLIDDSARKFSNWTGSNFTAIEPSIPSVNPTPTQSPFSGGGIYSSFVATGTQVTLTSPALFTSTNINLSISNFCVNFFLYQNPTYVSSYQVGYNYQNSSGTQVQIKSNAIPAPSSTSWINFNNTYTLPKDWKTGTSISIFIIISFTSIPSSDTASVTMCMNGLSVGQGSETTCYDDPGTIATSLPSELNLSYLGVNAYGILSDSAYYIVKDNKLLAKNDALPIIYGTDRSTKIISSDSYGVPSLVFPGKGMLHENGRSKNYTLEMWIKINPSTSVSQKIIGPLDTRDGVYVKEGFITLVIDNEIASHFVSQWYRPMLLSISVKNDIATLMINGEQVISMPFSKNTVTLSQLRDWWGIYSYSSTSIFEVDCISIYPYVVPENVAKRRFVYGQGAPSVQSFDNSYTGTSTTIEFPTSQYDASVIYPDVYRWDSGYFNNLNATRDYLSVPDYKLPTINIGGRDLKQWYADNLNINNIVYSTTPGPNFITFRPNTTTTAGVTSWNTNGIQYQENCYLKFSNLNILNDRVSAIYGIFEIESSINTDRTLISFYNTSSNQYFDIRVNGTNITYYLNNVNVTNNNLTISLNTPFAVGVNIDLISTAYGYDVSKFFSSPASVQVYIGGNGTNTFEGKIYSIGFSNKSEYSNISSNFDSNGIVLNTLDAQKNLLNHITSYTLLPEYEYGNLFLDISIYGEWEEYFPLTYFATYVKDENGNNVYDLDMLQLNIGYESVEYSSAWNYLGLQNSFQGSTYLNVNSTYSTYTNLKNKNESSLIFVSQSSVQSYVTFQRLSTGANTPLSSFNNQKSLPVNRVIDADSINTTLLPNQAYNTAFAISDNVIIYPPKSKPFKDYAMVVHMQVSQRSILKNPLKINSFEISAKNLNYDVASGTNNQKNYVGTKWGKNAYIATAYEFNTTYKNKNPLLIYKSSSPYLYNSKKSGIRLINETVNDFNHQYENQLFIPINESLSKDYKVSAMQFMVNPSFIPDTNNIKVFEITHKDGKFLCSISKNSNQAVMTSYIELDGYVIDGGAASGNVYVDDYDNGTSTTITFDQILNITGDPYLQSTSNNLYQNGRIVSSATLNNDEWTCIGVVFPNELDFGGFSSGGISLFGGFTFNNISYYQSSGLGFKVDTNTRTWNFIEYVDGNNNSSPYTWSYWNAAKQTWQTVYVINQKISNTITPKEIYQAYTGTNSITVDDNYGITVKALDTEFITSATWLDIYAKPA